MCDEAWGDLTTKKTAGCSLHGLAAVSYFFPITLKENLMDNQTLSAIVFIVALGLLGLYLLRRRSRKNTGK